MTFSLSQLNKAIAQAVQSHFPDRYQVIAEISEIGTRASGHCYLNFIEKDAIWGETVAKAPAHIWRGKWNAINTRFQQQTGQKLQVGMKILALVEVDMHMQYGYSLNVIDIDPSYTLGEKAARRQAVIRQLKEDGVYDLNRELYLPRPVQHLAVISSKTAAGYGDFSEQLKQSGYSFSIELFEAVMQGDAAPSSIIKALDRILRGNKIFDAIVIIRGGGAADDLSCFDDYELASCIAQSDIPVLSGIGHERDVSVVDMVAHQSLKTPTAVAAFLINLRDEEYRLLDNLKTRLDKSVNLHIQTLRYAIATRANSLQLAAISLIHRARASTTSLNTRLQTIPQARIRTETMRIAAFQKQLDLLNPQNILDRGYSFTTKDGILVRDAKTLIAGDTLTSHFKHGKILSKVIR